MQVMPQKKHEMKIVVSKIVFVAVFLCSMPAFACDICGCGVGNNYVGILPDFGERIAGVRYRTSSLWSDVGDGGAHTYLTTQEHYRTLEAWAGWNVTRKVRLMMTVPYNFISKEREGVKNRQSGVGDMSVFGYYRPLARRTQIRGKLLMQSMWIGGGVKLATGKYEPANHEANANNPNLYQLGTGSYDFMLSGTYDIRWQDAGMNINMQYKVNTANSVQYLYGNKLSGSAQFYYKVNVKNVCSVAPNAGMQYEYAATDMDRGYENVLTGGRLLLASAGAEWIVKKRITFGANYYHPVHQDLARGTVKANDRWMMHVGILF